MKNEKLNVDRCWNASAPDMDDLGCHRWRALPYVEMTEHGRIAWHTCERCPARALHDPETEDGFEPEPIVVYPPSCFDVPAVRLWTNDTGITCPACASAEPRMFIAAQDGDPFELRHASERRMGGTTRCGLYIGPAEHIGPIGKCGCPSKASGELVHHEGCVEFQAAVEAMLMENDLDGRVSFQRAPEPLPIVHPPTDPVPACSRCGGLRGVLCGDCEGEGCESCDGDGDKPCPACNPRGDAPMATPTGNHPSVDAKRRTDLAPPSEELRQAMAERDPWLDAPLTDEERQAFEAAEHETGVPWDDDPPTLKRPTPVPAGACS